MPEAPKNVGGALVGRLASRLRFPQLFVLALVLFLLDLVVPDLIPFIDEILLGLATLLLGSWKVKKEAPGAPSGKPPIKDVTPKEARRPERPAGGG